MAFGLVGLVVLGGAGAILLGTLGPLEDAATAVEEQRDELVVVLGTASEALERAALSASNAGGSLRESAAAARDGAALTGDLATAFDQLAAVSAVEIFGTRPFGDLGAEFASVAGRARTLAQSLGTTAESLAANEADAAATAASLNELAGQLELIRVELGGDGVGTDRPPRAEAFSAIALARVVLLALLAWLAVPAVAAVWVGRRWSRGEPVFGA